MFRVSLVIVGFALVASGRALTRTATPEPVRRTIQFEPEEIRGDPELAAMSEAELYSKGTSAFEAGDFAKAVRYLGRACEAFTKNPENPRACYQSGLALERLSRWDDALVRFGDLADAKAGQGIALAAAFQQAEVLYHLGRYFDAADVLRVLQERNDIEPARKVEATVLLGVCLLEGGRRQDSEKYFRDALDTWKGLPTGVEIDTYYPAQAQFFLGELSRLKFEETSFDTDATAKQLSEQVDAKSQLLLAAQDNYLTTIKIGNPYWATASGRRIGSLYERLYKDLSEAPPPSELTESQRPYYVEEVKKKIRVLVTKAIDAYQATLDAAKRLGQDGTFIREAEESKAKLQSLLKDDGTTPATGGSSGQR